jgi:dihydroxyacetone kinase-like predicted kinase
LLSPEIRSHMPSAASFEGAQTTTLPSSRIEKDSNNVETLNVFPVPGGP